MRHLRHNLTSYKFGPRLDNFLNQYLLQKQGTDHHYHLQLHEHHALQYYRHLC